MGILTHINITRTDTSDPEQAAGPNSNGPQHDLPSTQPPAEDLSTANFASHTSAFAYRAHTNSRLHSVSQRSALVLLTGLGAFLQGGCRQIESQTDPSTASEQPPAAAAQIDNGPESAGGMESLQREDDQRHPQSQPFRSESIPSSESLNYDEPQANIEPLRASQGTSQPATSEVGPAEPRTTAAMTPDSENNLLSPQSVKDPQNDCREAEAYLQALADTWFNSNPNLTHLMEDIIALPEEEQPVDPEVQRIRQKLEDDPFVELTPGGKELLRAADERGD